ncbi:MAG: hypothetical protein M1144_05620 [Candidatus Thermoplasmatota archaeon]|jgi:hypothetical protein|nr:hypothetical protein [Candidatus Thermoplasmatota archaeon]
MAGCRAVITLSSDDDEPYTTLRRGAKDWIISENEEEEVTFLCPKCSAPIRQDIAVDIARREREEAGQTAPPRSREDSEDNDFSSE